MKQSRIAKQTKEEKNCRTVRHRLVFQNREEEVIQTFISKSRWLGGVREDCCPQRFKWEIEHREL